MALRKGLRLGIVARLGLAGALGFAIIGAVTAFERRKPAEAVAAEPQAVPAAAESKASINALLNGDAGDTTVTTGSIPPPDVKPALGTVSGLPIPRFVSLKADKVNVRQGPTRDHDVAWVFQRSGLPVEIVAEFENWRRIRDSDGAEGWVMQSMLSGRRTALVAPWSKSKTLSLYRASNEDSATVARLEPGVLATIKECQGAWCRVTGDRFEGWLRQNEVWGAYPGEVVD
jgi:SH3-like domain-containing protein